MILVRDVFQLKFGEARQGVAVMKEGLELMRRTNLSHSPRLLTDVVGKYYTLVLEQTFESLAAFETVGRTVMSNDEFHQWYQRLIPHVEKGHREIFTIVS